MVFVRQILIILIKKIIIDIEHRTNENNLKFKYFKQQSTYCVITENSKINGKLVTLNSNLSN